jgi:hypothetical protein
MSLKAVLELAERHVPESWQGILVDRPIFYLT